MQRIIWQALYRGLLALADCDDALWLEFRRGLLKALRTDNPAQSRDGLRQMARAIARRHQVTEEQSSN